MNKKALKAFVKQAAKGIKSQQDLTDFRKILTKVTVESALNSITSASAGMINIHKLAVLDERIGRT